MVFQGLDDGAIGDEKRNRVSIGIHGPYIEPGIKLSSRNCVINDCI